MNTGIKENVGRTRVILFKQSLTSRESVIIVSVMT